LEDYFMPFCATCGTQVEGRFCAKCGSPVAAAAPPPPGASAPPPPQGAYVPPQQGAYVPPQGGYVPPQGAYAAPAASAMADNVACTLCYVLGLVTGIIFLLIAPYNQNRLVRFHAFQSIFFHVACIALWIALAVVSSILAMMHLWFLTMLLYPLIGLAIFVGWIYLMISAYQGKKVVLPVIGPLAEKQA
jgi:uncharacterized membrane protein